MCSIPHHFLSVQRMAFHDIDFHHQAQWRYHVSLSTPVLLDRLPDEAQLMSSMMRASRNHTSSMPGFIIAVWSTVYHIFNELSPT